MAWYLPLWLENGSEVQTQYTYINWWPDVYRSGLKTGLRFKPSTYIPTDGLISTALAWKRVWGSNPVHIYQLMAYRSGLKTGLRFKPSTHIPTDGLPLWLENGSEVQTQYTYNNWWPAAYRSGLKTGLRFKPSTHIPTDGLPLWLENGSEVQTQYIYTNWWPTALAWKRVWGSNPVHIYQLMAYRSGLKTGLRFKPSTYIPTDGLPLWLENGSEVQTQYIYTNWWPTALAWKRVWGSNPVHIYQLTPTALAWKRVWGSNPVHIYQLMAWYLPLCLENGSEVQTQYTYTNWWPDIYRSGLKTGLRFNPSTHISTDGLISTALAWKRVWGSNPVHIYQLMAWYVPLWLENGSEVQSQYTYTNWWPDIYRSGLKTGLRFKPSTHIPTDGLICTALAWKRVWGSIPVHIYQLMAWYLPLWLENGSEVQTQYTYTNWWPDAYRPRWRSGYVRS